MTAGWTCSLPEAGSRRRMRSRIAFSGMREGSLPTFRTRQGRSLRQRGCIAGRCLRTLTTTEELMWRWGGLGEGVDFGGTGGRGKKGGHCGGKERGGKGLRVGGGEGGKRGAGARLAAGRVA